MRAWRDASLRTRLLVVTSAIVALSVGLTLAIGVVLTRRAVEHATIRGLGNQADLLAARERNSLAPLFHLQQYEPSLAKQHERAISLPLRPSSYLTAKNVAELRRGRGVQGSVHANGTTYYMAARPVAGKAFVLLRKKRLDASMWPFAEGLLLAGLVGAVLAAALSFLFARAIRRPVVRVAEASRRLAQGEPHVELPVEGSGELAQLARSFNEMAAQLARARETEQAFLLSVSHELKTPLTAIRGYAEGLADGALPPVEAGDVIRREAKRLERLVQDLLDLARMNRSAFQVHREEIDLAETARDAAARYEAQADAFGVELRLDAAGSAPAVGDADRALQVLSNLVENALRSTPAGGSVTVRAAPGLLEVADTGPGLAADELRRAFERFFLYSRYGAERTVGTGLGLAIVKELTEAMDGRVEVANRRGGGLAFSVRLPLGRNAAVDDPALERAGRPLPEQDEAAALEEQLREREVTGEQVVPVVDGASAAGRAAVRHGDDVVLHRRLDRPA